MFIVYSGVFFAFIVKFWIQTKYSFAVSVTTLYGLKFKIRKKFSEILDLVFDKFRILFRIRVQI